MKQLPSAVVLMALTQAPLRAELVGTGGRGFFEPLIGYERRVNSEACACDTMIDRIERAVDAIVSAPVTRREPILSCNSPHS